MDTPMRLNRTLLYTGVFIVAIGDRPTQDPRTVNVISYVAVLSLNEPVLRL